jgi:hypothetical protein
MVREGWKRELEGCRERIGFREVVSQGTKEEEEGDMELKLELELLLGVSGSAN